MSVWCVSASMRTCSGDMYAGEPTPVICVVSWPSRCWNEAPKSPTLVSPYCESRMLPGLMSRWITPCWNAYSSARMHLKMISTTLLSGSSVLTSACASSVLPGTYSITR